MHYCSIAYSQLGPANIEHNNGDDDVDDGQAEDHDIYCDHFHNYWWSGWWFWLFGHIQSYIDASNVHNEDEFIYVLENVIFAKLAIGWGWVGGFGWT